MFVSRYPALSSSEPSWRRRHLCSRTVARPASWTKPLETWTATESCVHVTAQKCTNITLDWTFLFFLFFTSYPASLQMGLILLLLHQPLFPPLVHLLHSENLFDSLAKKKGTKKNIRRWCGCTLHWQNESYPLDWIRLSLTAINSFKEEAGMIRFLHPAPFQTHDWNE